jgi:hypothetical protein
MPAVAAGLDLNERVVRRHVAKLEAAGWLARTPWIRGECSAVWLTAAGIDAVGLGAVRAVPSPPGATTLTHGIVVGWTDRQKRILEGWRDALLNDRYSAVQYDCTDPSVTRWINRLARKVWLPKQTFTAVTQTSAAEIASVAPIDLTPAEPTTPAAPKPASDQPPAVAPELPTPEPAQPARLAPAPPPDESGETVDERLQRYLVNAVTAEPPRRRRWRR